ncbi:MAG TPA: hypothetical protein GYA06_05050 [Chloroflexi bacterium]|nr:hypothetical protein [Chloroflexota bacterium]
MSKLMAAPRPTAGKARTAIWLQGLGGVGLLFCLGVAVVTALQVFLDPSPLPAYPADRAWALAYAAAFAFAGLSCWLWRGRPLLLMSLLGAAGLGLVALTRAGLARDLAGLAAILGTALGLGSAALRRLRVADDLTLLERLGLGTALGLAALMALMTALGLAGLLYRPLVLGLLALLWLAGLPGLRRYELPALRRAFQMGMEAWRKADLRLPALLLALGLIVLIAPVLWSAAPALRYDALTYHLYVPQVYLQQHGVVPIPEAGNATFAHYAEMLYALGMAIAGQPLPGMLHLSMGLLAALLTFTLGRRLAGPRAGGLAALALLSAPLIVYEAATAYIDLFVTLFAMAMVYAAWSGWRTGRRSWYVLAGLYGGTAFGVKLTAGPVILALLLVLAGALLWRERRLNARVWTPFLMMGLAALPLALPWMARDWLWTGDPFFPYGAALLGLPAGQGLWEGVPFTNSLGGLLRYPWDLVVNARSFYHEAPGAITAGLPLLALPWLYLHSPEFNAGQRRRFWAGLALMLLAAALLYLTRIRLARYLIPVFPLFALGFALNLEALWRVLARSRMRALWAALGLAAGLVYLQSGQMALLVRSYAIEERHPVRLFLGLESSDEFLSRSLAIYPVYRFLDGEPGRPHRVLSVGNEFHLYTGALIDGAYDSGRARRVLAGAAGEEDLAARMAEQGYTHLLINIPEQRYRPDKYEFAALTPEFTARYGELIFAHQGILLYRFHPEGAPALEGGNLLADPGFEAFNPAGADQAWSVVGQAALEPDPAYARSGSSLRLQGPTPPEGYGYVFQRVQVEGGKPYTAGYWVYVEQPVSIQLQVHWLDEGGMFDRSLEWQTAQPGWNWLQFTVMAPGRAVAAELYASAASPGTAWFDDLCLARGDRCPAPEGRP